MGKFNDLIEKCAEMIVEDRIKGHTISFCGVYINNDGKVISSHNPA